MKIRRRKTCNRHLAFYKQNYGLHEPFQILVDLTFCQAALEYKILLKEQVPKYLDASVKLVTTKCILHEGKALGSAIHGALTIASNFSIRKCGHKKAKFARECIMDYVGETNPRGLFVATQDKGLWDALRLIPGVPLLHINHNALVLEKPNQASISGAEEKHLAKVSIGEHELETIAKMKAAFLPTSETKPRYRKRKGPKEPNPLSCKKKKNLKTKQNDADQETNKSKKRKRRRKHTKVPDHVIQELSKANDL